MEDVQEKTKRRPPMQFKVVSVRAGLSAHVERMIDSRLPSPFNATKHGDLIFFFCRANSSGKPQAVCDCRPPWLSPASYLLCFSVCVCVLPPPPAKRREAIWTICCLPSLLSCVSSQRSGERDVKAAVFFFFFPVRASPGRPGTGR